jgi:DNA-binding response OmpR family regulator
VANLVAFAALSFFVYKKMRARKQAEPVPTSEPAVAVPHVAEPSGLLHIGNTAFDPANLYVQVGDARQPLTFREAKLLRYLAERPNQVLEREAIMAAVWEDEGIIVGRSLDVFVSRLRKILQNDPTVKLANVHGVGYRLEV